MSIVRTILFEFVHFIHPQYVPFIFYNRPNGVVFTAPPASSSFESAWQPKEGDVVSFKHRGFMLGSMKPKLPALLRVRSDLTWDSVVKDWQQQRPRAGTTDNNKL